jgi:hypothetical protein
MCLSVRRERWLAPTEEACFFLVRVFAWRQGTTQTTKQAQAQSGISSTSLAARAAVTS